MTRVVVMLSRKAKHLALIAKNSISSDARFFTEFILERSEGLRMTRNYGRQFGSAGSPHRSHSVAKCEKSKKSTKQSWL